MRVHRLFALCFVLLGSVFLWGAANCINSSPVVTDDAASNTGQLTYVDVLANDTEPDGELMTLAVTGGSCQSVGSVTVETTWCASLRAPRCRPPARCSTEPRTLTASRIRGR